MDEEIYMREKVKEEEINLDDQDLTILEEDVVDSDSEDKSSSSDDKKEE